MKIKKKGNQFKAYRDENDVDSKGEFNSRIKIGVELGSISITTGKFVGNTVCLVELSKKQDEYVTSLVDEVIEQIKTDASAGDVTVLEEILKHVPIETLIQSLPEEEWSKYR